MATDPGAHASEYADMSNVKPGEIPGAVTRGFQGNVFRPWVSRDLSRGREA